MINIMHRKLTAKLIKQAPDIFLSVITLSVLPIKGFSTGLP